MMQLCGDCVQQVAQAVPVLLNPVTWALAFAALVAVVAKKGGK
jgi:hypothetical protein